MSSQVHVYIVRGSEKSLETIKQKLADRIQINFAGADYLERVYAQFGIDDARSLLARAQLRAIDSARRAFTIVATTITVDAQNALLKLFEEPPADAFFVLVVPNPHTLLPTLRSRAQMLEMDIDESEMARDTIEFLKSSTAERLEFVKSLYQKDKDEERDIAPALEFLSSLEQALSKRSGDAAAHAMLSSVYTARKYIGDKGSLIKSLLEAVALS